MPQLKTLMTEKKEYDIADLIRRYGDMVHRLAVRLTGSTWEAEEVTQETFIRVWENIGKYDSRYRMTTWIYRIAVNIATDRFRRKKSSPPLEQDTERIRQLSSGKIPDNELETKEIATFIRYTADCLPAMQRTIFILREVEGLENREIAEITGMNDKQIRDNLYLAKKNIREKLKKL